MIADETKEYAQVFVDKAVVPGTMVNTDSSPSLINLKGVDVDFQVTNNDPVILDRWLPWVHKFISNAKAWVKCRMKHPRQQKTGYTESWDHHENSHNKLQRCNDVPHGLHQKIDDRW